MVGTFTTPSGSTRPVSHPIVIQPSDQGLPLGVIMGVEGLTFPSDQAAMVTITVARLVDPLGSCTLLQGLAGHQATVVGRYCNWDNPLPGCPWTHCCSLRLYQACGQCLYLQRGGE